MLGYVYLVSVSGKPTIPRYQSFEHGKKLSEFRVRFEELRALEEKLSDVQRIELNRRFDYALAISDLKHQQFPRYEKDKKAVETLGKLQWWVHRALAVVGVAWWTFSTQSNAEDFGHLASDFRSLFYLLSFFTCYLLVSKTLAENRAELAGRKILETNCLWDSVARCYPEDKYLEVKAKRYPMGDHPVTMDDRKQMYSLELRASLISHISDPPRPPLDNQESYDW